MTPYDNEEWRMIQNAFAWVALISAAVAFGFWQESANAGLFLFGVAVWFRWGN